MIVTAILAKNEADKDLRDVLIRASEYSDTILLLDDGSTDDTPEIARQLGAKVKHRNNIGMWGNEAPARAELWDWAASEAKDGWVIINDADMLLQGDPRPLAASWSVNTWCWVLYDLWSDTEYRSDTFWQGHEFPRPWMFRPSIVPMGWTPIWPDRGLHTGHAPLNWPMIAGVCPEDLVNWRHRAYLGDDRRVAKWRAYLSRRDCLTPNEIQHADSILPTDHPARGHIRDGAALARA